MESERNELAKLFPNVAAQMRGTLSNLHLAAAQLAPAAAREQDPELDKRAALLDQSYYQLLRLVNSLSMAACLTEEKPLTLQDRDIVDLIGEQCESAASLAPLLGLELRFVCSMERHVCAVDPRALEHILSHLLSNAFKFTPAGGTVTVELRRSHGRVVIAVEDSGCGIPEELHKKIFEPFFTTKEAGKGTGLGLAIVAQVVEDHQGTIRVDSMTGSGTTFTVRLPRVHALREE